MDEFNRACVSGLYTRLMSKTLIKVIQDLAPADPISPSFELISDKLTRNEYLTPFDFALDIRTLFIAAQKAAGTNHKAVLAISDLSNWFEKHLHRLPRSKDEEFYCRLNKQRLKLETVRRAMSLSGARADTGADIVAAADPRIPKHAPAPLINEVQQLLTEATTPEVQLKLLSVLKRHLPNFDPAATVVLQAREITAKCAEEMREVLRAAQQERLEREHSGA